MTSLDQYRPEKSTVLPNSAGIERMFANMKKEQDRYPPLPCSCGQNSSDIAPCTVWTTRAARCAGSAW